MSTRSNAKWSRIDGRMAEARRLVDMWASNRAGNQQYVLARAQTSVRMLAAIVHAGDTPKRTLAAIEICEAIARERVQ
jgi:hypothetical protein